MNANKPGGLRLSPAFVEGQRLGHRILGLGLGGLLYLICITGVICVFYVEYERWEQPGLPEMAAASPEAVARAVAHARRQAAESPQPVTDIFVGLPNPDMPRLVAGDGHSSIGFDAAGDPVGSAAHDLTHFIMELHYSLHLHAETWPINPGLVIVGLVGIGLLALLVGGALSLPRLFRDAFRLRLGGSWRVTRTDIHNRIGVWGLPFHAVVTVTGAIMGLGQLIFGLAAVSLFGGDMIRAYDQVFGANANPALERALGPAPLEAERITRAVQTLHDRHPDKPPLFLGLRDIGTPKERLEIWAGHPDRLVYGEAYLFDAAGDLVGPLGNASGAAGLQVYSSLFRLHVGGFGGWPVKLAYAVMGLGLCWLCITGFDIWLAKAAQQGRRHDRLRRLWAGLVWGVPALVALTAIAHLAVGAPPVPVFWAGLALWLVASLVVPGSPGRGLLHGPSGLALCLIALPLVHGLRFGADAFTPAGVQVNLPLLLIGLGLLLWPLVRQRPALVPAGGALVRGPAGD